MSHILYVEDNTFVSEALIDFLEWEGFDVEHASDGSDAWEKFQADPTAYDIVLTDLKMPNMSGSDLATKVRGISLTTPIVVLSGYITYRVATKLNELQVNRILNKPIKLDVLSDTLKHC